VAVSEFERGLDYLSDEPGKNAHPLLIATAEKVLARLDRKNLRVAYAAFQYGYVLAQVDAAKKWGKSHTPKYSEDDLQFMRNAVDQVKSIKARQPQRSYKDIEADVADRVRRSPRTIRRWRKKLSK